MGIVNLTPDSFSGDGTGADVDRAIRLARHQLETGADILDIGAESSRPGAIQTPEDEELRRLIPVLREIVELGGAGFRRYLQARGHACRSRCRRIDDQRYQRAPPSGALAAVAASDCAICLMHMQGEPGTMQVAPHYDDVVREVRDFLAQRVACCREAGIDAGRLVLDPGFGFGKSLEHNLALFRALTVTGWNDLPLLVGVSRKSMLGAITGQPVERRVAASLAAAAAGGPERCENIARA